MSLKFELYTRAGCHLCEEMERDILPLQNSLAFEAQIIVINGDEALEQEYGERVPVLAHGDDIICEYVIDEDNLKKAVRQFS